MWLIVVVYAVGGLTVAVVIKYADNILKGFATSLAIIASCLASTVLFDFRPTLQFIIGVSLVLVSIYIYSAYEPAATISSSSSTLSSSSSLPSTLPSSFANIPYRRLDSIDVKHIYGIVDGGEKVVA